MKTLRSVEDLLGAGLVAPELAEGVRRTQERYAVGVTEALARQIDPADPDDPIARQFIPRPEELNLLPHERADPIGDHAHEPVRGLIHRYDDRALLKVVSVCPVYCRFCFRREMVGPGHDPGMSQAELEQALSYLSAHPEVREVILTGGDPFMLSPRRAGELRARLEGVESIEIMRWHTRMPVADPERVSEEYVRAIRSRKRAVYVVLHANHPAEMTAEALAACSRLVDAGVPVLSQSVLLKGVNADIATLERLMRIFVSNRILPYYLHHPDLAPGTSHFRLSVDEGQALVLALRDRLSGLCQPSYVLDIPGGVSKAVLSPSDAVPDEQGIKLRGRDGRYRRYKDVS